MRQPALLSILVVAALLPIGGIAEAQQAGQIPVIGYLSADEGVQRRFFRIGLRELGYVNGQNISVIQYFAIRRLDRLPMLAATMINNHKVDVIVVTSTVAAQAAKKATTTIPIVVVAGTDLVKTGLVESLAHPGGNITGITMFDEELAGKQLELLKETVSTVSRVGVLWNSGSATGLPIFKQIEATARALGVELHSMDMRTTKVSPGCSMLFLGPECPDFDIALKAAIQRGVGGFHGCGEYVLLFSPVNAYFRAHGQNKTSSDIQPW